jgi:hypothetical protein
MNSNSYNPDFDALLDDMRALHARKGHDYARNDNPYSNFEEAAAESGVDVDTVFKVMVGIKNARIRELERSGKTPANEALLDSYMDRLMYCALQLSYMRRRNAAPAFDCSSHRDPGDECQEYGHGV